MVIAGPDLPQTVEVSAGQSPELTCVEAVSAMHQITMRHLLERPREPPKRLAGIKGYSYNRADCLRKCGGKPLIPRRENEDFPHDGRPVFDQQAYMRQHGQGDDRLVEGMPSDRCKVR